MTIYGNEPEYSTELVGELPGMAVVKVMRCGQVSWVATPDKEDVYHPNAEWKHSFEEVMNFVYKMKYKPLFLVSLYTTSDNNDKKAISRVVVKGEKGV